MIIYKDKKVEIEVTEYYYKLTSGDDTWYWNRETGGYDGHSKLVNRVESITKAGVKTGSGEAHKPMAKVGVLR